MIKVNYRALGMLSTNCYVVENPDSQKAVSYTHLTLPTIA